MRTARLLAAVVVVATGLAAPAVDARPKPKPMNGSYDLFLPVPYALEDSSGSHCREAPEGLSKDTRPMALPYAGKLKVELTEVVGDWVMELFDEKGTLLASGASLDPTATVRTLTYKRKVTGPKKVMLSVCNFAGGPNGHVAWSLTPA